MDAGMTMGAGMTNGAGMAPPFIVILANAGICETKGCGGYLKCT